MPEEKHYVHEGTFEPLAEVRRKANKELEKSIEIQHIIEIRTFLGPRQFEEDPHPNLIKTDYRKEKYKYEVPPYQPRGLLHYR